jgi:ABC-type polysaccharide/polyol phosphate export permease
LFTAARSFVELLGTNIKYYPRTLGMAKVSLDKRYSGSLLGMGWAIVKPTLFIFVYWFAVSVGIRGGKPMGDIPFILWLMPGIMPWFFISDALTVGGSSIRVNSHLVTKMVYPVATIPVSEVLSLFYVHLMMMGIVISIFLLSGYGLTVYFVQIFDYLFCTLAFAVVVATLLSALTAVSRDIEHMVRSTIQVLFWLSPIIWSVDKLSGVLKLAILANPIAYLVQGYRDSFVFNRWFFVQWQYTTYFWVFLIALTLLSSFLFSKLQREFADVL